MAIYGEPLKIKDKYHYYEEVFAVRNWSVVQTRVADDHTVGQGKPVSEGPSMYHDLCHGLTHVLIKSDPKCHGCQRPRPSRIQVVYSLMNFERGASDEYFEE